eukprot:2499541-Rhodomonas_salina.4
MQPPPCLSASRIPSAFLLPFLLPLSLRASSSHVFACLSLVCLVPPSSSAHACLCACLPRYAPHWAPRYAPRCVQCVCRLPQRAERSTALTRDTGAARNLGTLLSWQFEMLGGEQEQEVGAMTERSRPPHRQHAFPNLALLCPFLTSRASSSGMRRTSAMSEDNSSMAAPTTTAS